MQHQRTGIAASFASHAVAIVALSFVVFQLEPTELLETEARISDELPTGVTTTIVDDVALVPESEVTFDEIAAADDSILVPVGVGELIPHGLTDSAGESRSSTEGDAKLLTGIDAAVAQIQERVRKAGGKSGEIQFSLSWEDKNDLDLHVITPRGDRIHFHKRRSKCGGHLDVDMNVQPESQEPVENVRWPKGKGQSGRYTIYVNFYRRHVGSGFIPFKLAAKLGDETEFISSEVFPGKQLRIYRFIHIRSNVSETRGKKLRAQYEKLQLDEEELASKLLREATSRSPQDNNKLMKVAYGFPHTDAALEALRLLPNKPQK